MSNTESMQPKQPVESTQTQPKSSRPNETGTISVQAHMRIFDPVTQQVYMEGRA